MTRYIPRTTFLSCLIGLVLGVLLAISPIASYAIGNLTSYNGHSYQRFENPMTWPAAKTYCESQGGYLTTITSKEENDFIFSQLGGGSSYSLWIGGTDTGHEGTWSWVNNEPWSYSNWDVGEPNNAYSNENSIEMVGTAGKWNDNNSDRKFRFSCEWNNTPSSPGSHAVDINISEVSPGRYQIIGTLVDANNKPACGLALASGRCMFSCGPGSLKCEGGTDSLSLGQFDLTNLPREPNGTINMQTFVFGSMPGLQVVNSDGTVQLVDGGANSANSRAINTSISAVSPGRYRLIGTVVDANNKPACGLALASGRCMFSCGAGSLKCEGGTANLSLGQFDLTDLPTESDGTLNVQTFVFGSMPGLQVISPGDGGCSYTIDSASGGFPYEGGKGTVTVTTQNNCAWTARSAVDWISLTEGASGTGSGVVNYVVSRNDGITTRIGTLTIAGQTLTVLQIPKNDNSGGR